MTSWHSSERKIQVHRKPVWDRSFPPSFRSNLTVNLGVLVFVITKTKTPTKTISKISTKSNYDRLKTIIRQTNKNYYHTRSDLRSANNLLKLLPRESWPLATYCHAIFALYWLFVYFIVLKLELQFWRRCFASTGNSFTHSFFIIIISWVVLAIIPHRLFLRTPHPYPSTTVALSAGDLRGGNDKNKR